LLPKTPKPQHWRYNINKFEIIMVKQAVKVVIRTRPTSDFASKIFKID